MGDPLVKGRGLIFRTSRLLNNRTFSDVTIEVQGDIISEKFYAHKLLLSMASDKFSSMFYDKPDTLCSIKILNFTPSVVHMALWYIYCDELKVKSISEAVDLWKFAKEFGIKDLEKESLEYTTHGELTADRIFILYEIALRDNSVDLLTMCQNFVCNEAQTIFTSDQFCEISLPVLRDILKLNGLSVKSELDIIKGVLRWCKYDCKKKNRPYEGLCIRESINPLLPFLRFLTLTPEEFCDFVEENNIFTSHESSVLTRKILQPSNPVRVPNGFCAISRPRVPGANRNYNIRPNTAVNTLESKHIEQSRVSGGSLIETRNVQMQNRAATMVPKVSSPLFSYNNYDILPSNSDITQNMAALNTAVFKTQPRHALQDSGNLVNDTLTPTNQDFQYVKHDAFQNQFGKVNKSPVLKVMPQPKNTFNQRIFEFPLENMLKGIGAMCTRDVKCSARICIIKGVLVIYGVELKIISLNHCSDEIIDVYASISGKFPVKEYAYHEKLSNNTLSIMFSEPLRLLQNNFAEIEITVEDMKLNRCNICRVDSVELNSSSATVAEIFLKSNQSNENEGIFFLINRLIYSPS